MAEDTASTTASESSVKEQFAIQNIYIKDVSFETTNSFELYTRQSKPKVETEMVHKVNTLNETSYEVILSVTLTVKVEEQVAFLVEVQQAGVFLLQGFVQDRLSYMLNSYCPNILFPYTRELISNLIARGGFPPLYLTPVNFDAVYAQRLNRAKAEKNPAH